MTKADARAVGDQTATTLSCQRGSRKEGSFSSEAPGAVVIVVAVAGSISAFSTVSSMVASRPPPTSTICVHW